MENQLASAPQPHPVIKDLASLRAQIFKTQDPRERQMLVHEYMHGVITLRAEEQTTALQQLAEILDQSRVPVQQEQRRLH